MSTWSYENRVSKQFAILLNFPCLIACLLCCLLMSFFFWLVLLLGICVEVDVDKLTILPTPPPPPQFFSLPTILSDGYQFEISGASKAGFGACRLAVECHILVTLTKVSRRASCKVLRWDKVITIHRVCIVHYRIVFSFHLAKRINHPDTG